MKGLGFQVLRMKKENKQVLNQIKRQIIIGYGNRKCKDHDVDCCACKVWDAYDVLERALVW